MPLKDSDPTFFSYSADRIASAFSDSKTSFLTVATTLFAATTLIPPLREAAMITSPVITINLPVLTAAVVVVAVVYARGGNLSVKSKSIEVLLEDLNERDLSGEQKETWLEQPSRNKENIEP